MLEDVYTMINKMDLLLLEFIIVKTILHSVTDDLHNFNVKLENDYSLEATTDSINDYSTNLLDMVEPLQTTDVNLKNIQYSTLVILIEMVSKTVEAHSDDCSSIYDGKTGIINNPMKHAESLDNILKKQQSGNLGWESHPKRYLNSSRTARLSVKMLSHY